MKMSRSNIRKTDASIAKETFLNFLDGLTFRLINFSPIQLFEIVEVD